MVDLSKSCANGGVPRPFSVGNYGKFGVLHAICETNIHTSKKFLVNSLGDYCWEFVVELEGSLMRKRNHDSHKNDV